MWDLAVIAAAGGSVRGLLDVYELNIAWRDACRKHLRQKKDKSELPMWSDYYKISSELSAAALQVLIGGAAGALFAASHQITSAWAAALVGISAPAMLTYLASSKMLNSFIAAQRSPTHIDPSADAIESSVPESQAVYELKPDESEALREAASGDRQQ
ncbi:hypothetical protein ACWDBW_27700 [Streptomyces sp. NPDC001107]